MRGERSKGSLESCRLSADRVRAHEHPREQHDYQHDAREAQLLGYHGEQEVGVRFGKVEELFDAGAQAHAEPFAATERDQRMRELITLTVRVCPRIEEPGKALQPIRRDTDQHPQGDR